MEDVKKTEVDYGENNGLIGHPITNQLMEQDRAALSADEAGAVVVDLNQTTEDQA
ncbi:hypothetical protein [Massilia luteola]|uniref:hypothetical protein n=1 Tax=Massilia luteola TaxID=3081751 RepID=UPI002ACBF88E|nr:hypothetical protein [Massilia sp. Gc5]